MPNERENRLEGMAAKPQYVLAFLLVLTLLAFGKSLTNEYLYDGKWMLERLANPLQPLSILFDTQRYGEATGIMSWRPLGSAAMMLLDVRLFGMNAPLSKALSLLLHAINGWLLYLLVRRIASSISALAAALAAAAFVVHPLVSEAILTVGFRFDQWALMFTLLALIQVSAASPCPRRYVLAAVFFVLALLSKEIGVICIPLLPLVAWMLRRSWKESLLLLLGSAIIFILFLLVWRQFQYAGYTTEYLGGGGRALGIANFLVSASEIYFRRLLLPIHLRIDHQFQPITDFGSIRLLLSVIILGAAACATVFLAAKVRPALVGFVWVVVAFLPVSQLVPVPDPVAERFAYVPMAGAAIILAGLLHVLLSGKHGKPVLIVTTVILIAWSALSHRRAWDWRDDLTLNIANWENVDDRSSRALEALGALHMQKASAAFAANDRDAGARHMVSAGTSLEELLAREPNSIAANRLMAIWHLQLGRRDEARRYAEKAASLAPNDPDVRRLMAAFD